MRYSTTNLTHCHAPAGIAMVARGLCGRLLPGMQENPLRGAFPRHFCQQVASPVPAPLSRLYARCLPALVFERGRCA